MHVTRKFEMYRPCGAEHRKLSPEYPYSNKLLFSVGALGTLALIAVVGCGKKEAAGPPPTPEDVVADVIQ